jgi:hypothetical protein
MLQQQKLQDFAPVSVAGQNKPLVILEVRLSQK